MFPWIPLYASAIQDGISISLTQSVYGAIRLAHVHVGAIQIGAEKIVSGPINIVIIF